MREILITIDNKVGSLAHVCEIIGGAGINIDSISAYGDAQRGTVRLITQDESSALSALSKAGLSSISSDLVVIKVNDQPGELGKIARRLARGGVNVESIYLVSKTKGVLEFAIKTDAPGKALDALKH